MSEKLEKKTGDTVRILRPPPRVYTDLTGRNVWMGEVEPLELAIDDTDSTDPYNSVEITGHALIRTDRKP